jgi:uncharacterized Tic20 family protein
MQHSDIETAQRDVQEDLPGQGLASTSEVLYLLNLLLLPVVAFLILLGLYFYYRKTTSALALCHLKQTINASIWAGIMIVIVNVLILLLGGYSAASTWVIVIIYFITIHATFVFLGTYGLARSMNGKHYHYPLIGGACPESKAE